MDLIKTLSWAQGLKSIPNDQVDPNIKACWDYHWGIDRPESLGNRERPLAVGCKADTPNQHEFELARKPHRWARFRKIQAGFFGSLMANVQEYESDILRILNLPDISTTRKAVLLMPVNDIGYLDKQAFQEYCGYKQTEFSFSTTQRNELEEIFEEWEADLIDNSEGKAVLHFHQLGAFGLGLDQTFQMAQNSAPAGMEQMLASGRLPPSIENAYLKMVIKDGAKRIRKRLQTKYKPELISYLKRMARVAASEGIYPVDIARAIHASVGEGQAWYWLRLARSEMGLAVNSAFDAQGEALGIQYEEWSTAANPCEICVSLDGMVWKFREGPQPVSDTHPNCMCLRLPLWGTNKPVMKPWNRESPYSMSWSAEEIGNIQQLYLQAA